MHATAQHLVKTKQNKVDNDLDHSKQARGAGDRKLRDTGRENRSTEALSRQSWLLLGNVQYKRVGGEVELH